MTPCQVDKLTLAKKQNMATEEEEDQGFFSFLDLGDCTADEEALLRRILKEDKPEKRLDPSDPNLNQPPPHHAHSHGPGEEYHMQAGASVYAQYPNPNPVVYINNVTANVNVHHPPAPSKDDAAAAAAARVPQTHPAISPLPPPLQPPPPQMMPPPPMPQQQPTSSIGMVPFTPPPTLVKAGSWSPHNISFLNPQAAAAAGYFPLPLNAYPPMAAAGPPPGTQPLRNVLLRGQLPAAAVAQQQQQQLAAHEYLAAIMQQQFVHQQFVHHQQQMHVNQHVMPLVPMAPLKPPISQPVVQPEIVKEAVQEPEPAKVAVAADSNEKEENPEERGEEEEEAPAFDDDAAADATGHTEEDEEDDGTALAFGTVDASAFMTSQPVVMPDEFKKEEEQAENETAAAAATTTTDVVAAVAPAPKSWASLFKKDAAPTDAAPENAANSSGQVSGKPMAMIQPYNAADTTSKGEKVDSAAAADAKDGGGETSDRDRELAQLLKNCTLNHRAPAMKPRGLNNRSNWCFVNAILQALVACPPFFNLIRSLPKDLLFREEGVNRRNWNILTAVHSFISEFSSLDYFPKLNRRDKNKKNDDIPQGKTLEPTTIYRILLNLGASDTFKVVEGRQEDAEEFLTFLLNGLNDEMMALLKLAGEQEEGNGGDDAASAEEEDDHEWQEVGPKNRSCVTRRGGQLEAQHAAAAAGGSTGSSRSAKPPLADIFQGQIRSCVQHSNKEHTATLQPFFTLQLDIQSDKVKNVTEALNNNFSMEALDGYLCSKTKQEIEASRNVSFEELPPVLILHLKRFIYDGSSKGCQKLLKNINFPVDLEIGRDILSPNSKNKYQLRQRQYKLFAVVYHNGTEATKGHYVTDVYHTGLSTWIRCDDSLLKPMPESMVMAHSASSVPYILFYRRGDTTSASGAGTAAAGSTHQHAAK